MSEKNPSGYKEWKEKAWAVVSFIIVIAAALNVFGIGYFCSLGLRGVPPWGPR